MKLYSCEIARTLREFKLAKFGMEREKEKEKGYGKEICMPSCIVNVLNVLLKSWFDLGSIQNECKKFKRKIMNERINLGRDSDDGDKYNN